MRRAVVPLATAVALASCASPGDLSSAAAQDLRAHVAAVRASAEAMDPAAASGQLEELRGAVGHWLEAGELDRARAEEILAAADDVESALGLLAAPAEPPPADDPVEEPEDEAREPEDDDDGDDDGDEDDDDGEDGDSSGPGSGGSGGGDSG
ncbi:MAG TPA: hypothetical protein VHL78_01420 [Actinomycetota bacterium]|nr:hypothetical protein [Actinomycetota bacterium]